MLPPPKIDDIIYVPSAISLSHGIDDRVGGKAMVISVVKDDHTIWVRVMQFPGTAYNWKFLSEEQPKLAEKFGEKWARPDPDTRPEFNLWD